MIKRFIPVLDALFNLDYYERKKMILLGATCSCLIAAYSILRPLKTSVFSKLVGVTYQPYTKLLMLGLMLPIMYLYSLLIDRVKRDVNIHIIYIGYAAICFLFAYFLLDPIIGLGNTETSPQRLIGWLFYIAMDLFSSIIMTIFWSYTNSINTPSSANYGYNFITVGARIGGILSTAAAIQWLSTSLDETKTIPAFIAACGGLLVLASLFTYIVNKTIPAKYLEGYKPEAIIEAKEAEYKNKAEDLSIQSSFLKSVLDSLKKTFEGLRLLINNSYVFGIFILIYSFEIISAILDYQMQFLMVIENNNSVKESTLFMLRYTNMFQIVGLFFAIFGTAPLIKRLGVRFCISITPFMTIMLMGAFFFYNSLYFITIILVILRALNYGFNIQMREMLFIPTSHDVRYQAKAWIESTGRALSKSSGALINISSQQAAAFALALNTSFTVAIGSVWLIASILVGRKYQKTIESNKVIGRDA